MKQTLKGLVIVTTLSSIGLQGMQEIKSIKTTEPYTEITLVAVDQLSGTIMGKISEANGTARHLVIEGPIEQPLHTKFPFEDTIMIFNHKKKTIDIFTTSDIEKSDPTNTSGEWLLKIEKDGVSIVK